MASFPLPDVAAVLFALLASVPVLAVLLFVELRPRWAVPAVAASVTVAVWLLTWGGVRWVEVVGRAGRWPLVVAAAAVSALIAVSGPDVELADALADRPFTVFVAAAVFSVVVPGWVTVAAAAPLIAPAAAPAAALVALGVAAQLTSSLSPILSGYVAEAAATFGWRWVLVVVAGLVVAAVAARLVSGRRDFPVTVVWPLPPGCERPVLLAATLVGVPAAVSATGGGAAVTAVVLLAAAAAVTAGSGWRRRVGVAVYAGWPFVVVVPVLSAAATLLVTVPPWPGAGGPLSVVFFTAVVSEVAAEGVVYRAVVDGGVPVSSVVVLSAASLLGPSASLSGLLLWRTSGAHRVRVALGVGSVGAAVTAAALLAAAVL